MKGEGSEKKKERERGVGDPEEEVGCNKNRVLVLV